MTTLRVRPFPVPVQGLALRGEVRIHHLALRTDNVEKISLFYQQIFGLSEHKRSLDEAQALRSIWLLSEQVVLMIERREAGEPAVDSRTMEFLAFAVSPTEFSSWLTQAELRGSPVIEARTANTLYFRDPDGRRVGISKYEFAF